MCHFETGRSKCWGNNDSGQLGLGHTYTIGDGETPRGIDFIDFDEKIINMSLGFYHTCALLNNNNVQCWGSNSYGEIGLGYRDTIGDDEFPSSASNVNLGGTSLSIESGNYFSCVI